MHLQKKPEPMYRNFVPGKGLRQLQKNITNGAAERPFLEEMPGPIIFLWDVNSWEKNFIQ